MRWTEVVVVRVLGIVLGLLVVGLVGGYAVASVRDDDAVSIATASPVPAQSPAAPTPTPAACATDPDVASLATDLATVPDAVSSGAKHGYGLRLDVPTGWQRYRLGQSQWKWSRPDAPLNTYVLRVSIVAGLNQSADLVEQTRIAAYQSAQRDGNLGDFEVAQTGDTFEATYTEHGFCRLTMERVLTLGTSSAYVDLAVTGRLRDREGLMDLLARTTGSLQAD